jgi:RNA polymerase sigma-70 factor (ECF subfamily)
VDKPRRERSSLPSDKQLIRRLQDGEGDAFEQLIRIYAPRVYDLQCWLCGDRAAAEDLTQETFIAVWRDIGKFRGESRLLTWVHAVARNIALRHLKRRGRQGVPLEEAAELQAPSDTEALAERSLLRDQVREALQVVPIAQREALVLNRLHGLSQKETARALGRPLGTVKWQIAQGLQALREALLRAGVAQDEL